MKRNAKGSKRMADILTSKSGNLYTLHQSTLYKLETVKGLEGELLTNERGEVFVVNAGRLYKLAPVTEQKRRGRKPKAQPEQKKTK